MSADAIEFIIVVLGALIIFGVITETFKRWSRDREERYERAMNAILQERWRREEENKDN